MKLFRCQCCGHVLHFENTLCLACNRRVGYLPDTQRMATLDPAGPHWAEAPADGNAPNDPSAGLVWKPCANAETGGCNWMIPVPMAGTAPDYCPACRHNRIVPDLTRPDGLKRWQRIETAKRRMLYGLDRLGLPRPGPGDGHPQPLIFDFLDDDDPFSAGQVMTGHASGVLTIALSEADDARREAVRAEMGEAYRTLLGHFRHEVGHYYWDLLIRNGGQSEAFRTLFGDERADYAAALERHHQQGAPPGWEGTHVSAYATMHPWEDWAETWAHYLHMTDTLDTAAALGLSVDPPADDRGDLSAEVGFDPYRVRDVSRLLTSWPAVTVALNALARSMGQPDPWPFAMPAPVETKLGFVHRVVRAAGRTG